MFELTFGKFAMARKPIINGGAIRPTSLLFVYSFLGMILINCQEMGLIELFKRSLSRLTRGLPA